jgi:hypothetical protein
MRAIARLILDTVAEMPYTSIGTVHMDPPGPIPYWDRTMMFADLPKEAMDEFVALAGPDSDCPLVSVELRQLGGAMDREPAVPNAVPTRGLPYVMFAFGAGGPDQEDLMRGYLAKLISGLEAWSADRMMPNFMSAEEATAPAQLSGCLWRGTLRPPGPDQEVLRPAQPVPDEPQHRACIALRSRVRRQ